MADEKKTPRATIESSESPNAIEPAPKAAGAAAGGSAPQGDAGQPSDAPNAGGFGFHRIGEWVSETFPGHENAFWGGVAGLVIALLVFVVGITKTLIVALLVVVGVAVGQLADGDPKIINALRRFFSNNN